MTSKERARLRSLAVNLQPVFQIGKEGYNAHLVQHVDEYLEAHELIKLSVLDSAPETAAQLAASLAGDTRAEVVAKIGRKLILYRRSETLARQGRALVLA
ncbi:MAG: YhbY family RNA-binding protein [Oscillospiraceae bacterium]|nr:YhbY family RNA-binding protein [Oscillospiraceae bacterium]MDD4367518.1 YhbY family RNA-binding protein [Oscillospiraceae bacterium]